MNRIERYLATVVISYTLLVLLVLMALLGFSTFMSEVGDVNEHYSTWQAGLYSLLKLPNYSYQLFPVALLIGTLMGLGSLANHSELTVLRVTGWSVRRIFWAVAKAALVLWVIMALIGENIGSSAEAYGNKVRTEALNKSFSIGKDQGFWVRNNKRFIHIEQALSKTELQNLSLYQLEGVQLKQFQHISVVRYVDGEWWAMDIEQKSLNWNKSDSGTWLEYHRGSFVKNRIALPFQPEDLEKLNVKTRSMNTWELRQQIDFMQQNGVDASPLKLAFWKKIASPIVVLAMIAIVFPLIFGSQRQVSMGQRIFMGVLIGLLFHLANEMLGNLSVVYQLPVVLAAFIPAILLFSTALIWLRLQK